MQINHFRIGIVYLKAIRLPPQSRAYGVAIELSVGIKIRHQLLRFIGVKPGHGNILHADLVANGHDGLSFAPPFGAGGRVDLLLVDLWCEE